MVLFKTFIFVPLYGLATKAGCKKRLYALPHNILSFPISAGFSQGMVDHRIELGYQTTRRGIVCFALTSDTNLPGAFPEIQLDHVAQSTTGIRYDWSYDAGVWYTRDFLCLHTSEGRSMYSYGGAGNDRQHAGDVD